MAPKSDLLWDETAATVTVKLLPGHRESSWCFGARTVRGHVCSVGFDFSPVGSFPVHSSLFLNHHWSSWLCSLVSLCISFPWWTRSELHGSGSSRACCTSGQQLQVTALAMLLGPLAPKSPPNGGFLNRDSVTEPACAQLEQSLTWWANALRPQWSPEKGVQPQKAQVTPPAPPLTRCLAKNMFPLFTSSHPTSWPIKWELDWPRTEKLQVFREAAAAKIVMQVGLIWMDQAFSYKCNKLYLGNKNFPPTPRA